MQIDSLTLYRNGREELSPIERAVERLREHPYGNLQERYQKWLEKPM